MQNRIGKTQDEGREREGHQGPQPIGEILAELLVQYQTRYPEIRLAVVQTPAVAV